MLGTRTTFNLHLALVVLRTSAEDKATPVAGTAFAGNLAGGENYGGCGCALGNDASSALHDERRLGLLIALDDGAGLDSEFCTFGHVNPTLEDIGSALQSLLAGEDEFGVTVSNLRAGCRGISFSIECEAVAGFQTTIGAPDILLCRNGVGYWVVAATSRKHGGRGKDAEASVRKIFLHISCKNKVINQNFTTAVRLMFRPGLYCRVVWRTSRVVPPWSVTVSN